LEAFTLLFHINSPASQLHQSSWNFISNKEKSTRNWCFTLHMMVNWWSKTGINDHQQRFQRLLHAADPSRAAATSSGGGDGGNVTYRRRHLGFPA
jgi:hypothetical protein